MGPGWASQVTRLGFVPVICEKSEILGSYRKYMELPLVSPYVMSPAGGRDLGLFTQSLKNQKVQTILLWNPETDGRSENEK